MTGTPEGPSGSTSSDATDPVGPPSSDDRPDDAPADAPAGEQAIPDDAVRDDAETAVDEGSIGPVPPPPPGEWVPLDLRLSPVGVLGETLDRYAADFRRILTVTAAFSAPIFLITMLMPGLAIVATVLGVFLAGTTIALVGAGPRTRSIGEALSFGSRRAGWLFAVEFVFGVIALVPLFLAIIVLMILGRGTDVVVAILVVSIALVGSAWIGCRLILATPAVVLDGMRANPALTASRRLTRPRSVTVRIFATFVLVGLAIAALCGLVVLPLAVSVSFETVFVLGLVVSTIASPIGSIAIVVVYRRLTGAQSPSYPGVEAWRTPRAGRPFLIALLVLALAGTTTWVVGMDNVARGKLPILAGSVERGTVAFGTGADLETCRIHGQTSTFTSASSLYWMARFPRMVRPSDDVAMTVSFDGESLEPQRVDVAGADCYGTIEPVTGLTPGEYRLEFTIDGEIAAEGSFTVR